MERLSPSFRCPWLSVVAVWWSLVRFRRAIFVFVFGKSAIFGGRRACGSGFWSTRKSDRWAYSHGSQKHAQTPKIALLALKTARLEMAPRALGGAFLGVRADCSSRRTWRKLAVTWHFGHLALGGGGQTSAVVAARPKSRRFCRNGPNKQKRPKKAQNRRGCLNGPPQ